MIIHPTEWTAARELLVTLARGLSSVIASTSPTDFQREASIADRVLNHSFPLTPIGPFAHTVRLLPTLQAAQTQIARWIEILPAEPVDKTPKEARASCPKIVKSQASSEDGEGKNPRQAAIRPNSRDVPLSQRTDKEKIALRAQKLVEQVRGAIQTLSSSTYLEKPQSQPLKTALAKLKPLIDELIVALSETILDSSQEGSPNPFKHQPALSQSSDERLVALHRVLPSPIDKGRNENSERAPQEKQHRLSLSPTKERDRTVPQNAAKSNGAAPDKPEEAKTVSPIALRAKGEGKIDPVPKSDTKLPNVSKTKGEGRGDPTPNIDSRLPILTSWPGKKQPPPAHVETKVAPIAFPMSQPLPIAAAKKKKRKRYFFKDEVEDEERDHRS